MDRQQHGYTSSVTQREYSARLTTTFIFRNSSFSFMQMIPILFILNKHFIPVSRKMTRHVESLSPLHSVISLNTRWQTWARKLSPFQCVLPTFSCWERMRGCGSHHIYNQFILRRRKQNKSFPIIITINVKVFFLSLRKPQTFYPCHSLVFRGKETKSSLLCPDRHLIDSGIAERPSVELCNWSGIFPALSPLSCEEESSSVYAKPRVKSFPRSPSVKKCHRIFLFQPHGITSSLLRGCWPLSTRESDVILHSNKHTAHFPRICASAWLSWIQSHNNCLLGTQRGLGESCDVERSE